MCIYGCFVFRSGVGLVVFVWVGGWLFGVGGLGLGSGAGMVMGLVLLWDASSSFVTIYP